MRRRTIAVVGIVSILVAAAVVVPASGGTADLIGFGQSSIRSGDGAYPYPLHPRPCRGLDGRERSICVRRLIDAHKCAEGRERSIRVCSEAIVSRLADDDLEGRNDGTAGSALARDFLVRQLKGFSEGLNSSARGTDAYLQLIPGGANVVSLIPGTDLADEYVIVGAHYDHLGHECQQKEPGDTICNGATDNAAGVAAAVSVGRAIAAERPRRSVVLALWDQEEDGLVGSRENTLDPLGPLASTVAYVNFDIQGANLLPSLRNTTFAIGAETGGARLEEIVRHAIDGQPLDTAMLSWVFGLGRSDYLNFLLVDVPSVFFSDATGPCYHTTQDEVGVVDFGKLTTQIGTALAVTDGLANTDAPPVFDASKFRGWPPPPIDVTYDDLVALAAVVDRASADIGRFSAANQEIIRSAQADLNRIESEGRAAFGEDDVLTIVAAASRLVNEVLVSGECDGFLLPSNDGHGHGHDHGHGHGHGPGRGGRAS